MAVQLGISDGTRSEVLAGPLTEQSQVIITRADRARHPNPPCPASLVPAMLRHARTDYFILANTTSKLRPSTAW